MTDQNLEKAFVEEMRAMIARGTQFELRLSPIETWTLLSNLQLALRHPGNTGPGADVARAIARRLQTTLADSPILASIAEMGWHAENDSEWTDWPGPGGKPVKRVHPGKSRKERPS